MSYAWPLENVTARGALVLAIVALWALRLSVYITWRNWGEGEDHRYREIRRRNEPNFALKSLYLVFGLQAVLAWVVSAPLLAAQRSAAPLGALDWLGLALATFGLLFESFADWQLARFKAAATTAAASSIAASGATRAIRTTSANAVFGGASRVLGSRPAAVWSLVSPLLMTFLLLRVSGVTLLEQSIGDRRPGYADYVRRTSAFVPLPPRKLAVNRAAVDL